MNGPILGAGAEAGIIVAVLLLAIALGSWLRRRASRAHSWIAEYAERERVMVELRRRLAALPDPRARTDGRTPGRLMPNRFHEAAWIIGPPENLDIAPDVWIGAFCVIDALHDRLSIGAGSVIASGAHVYTHSSVKRTCGTGPLEHAPTRIGANVSICAGAIVLMGATVGDLAVIGAGAIVLGHAVVPPGATVKGVWPRREG